MKKSKVTDSQIIEALKRAEAGLAVPSLCREMAKHAFNTRSVSIRLACQALRVSQACDRYAPAMSDQIAHRLGKITRLAWIDHNDRQTRQQ